MPLGCLVATGDGGFDAAREECGVELGVPLTGVQSHQNRGAWRVEPSAQDVATLVLHLDLVTSDRSAADASDGLRIDPRMSGPYGLHVPWLEGDHCHRGPSSLGATPL